MEGEVIHQLAAAYALDVLTDGEEREYESHLAECPRCQVEVAAFSELSAALAYAAPVEEPPPTLRARVLAAAREAPNRSRDL